MKSNFPGSRFESSRRELLLIAFWLLLATGKAADLQPRLEAEFSEHGDWHTAC
jgi:hypothetical protein